MDWAEFERAAPDFAAAGIRLLTQHDGIAIGFIATVHQALHLAPVCPIFCERGVYLSVGASTPKRRDLDRDGRYVLHAFLAADDEEFRIAGRAEPINDSQLCSRVHQAIRFGAFDRDDPIYHLRIESSMWGYWEQVGRPGTRPVRRHWRARAGAV